MEMTVELFDNIINTSQDCVFWKDKDRRFLGVNQAFLDYYGFESEDVLIGKTDEDMGWHSDPEPFMQDELRVLSGVSTYKVQGKCIIKGEERDIIASKRPLYDGDRIVGLVGSFVDITDVLRRKEAKGQEVYTIEKLRKYSFFDKIIDGISLDEILDPLTGVLSRSYAVQFVRSLIAEKIPFTYSMLDLDNFKYINDTYGHGAGDKVLMTVSAKLAEYTEGHGLVGRFGGDELLLIDLDNTTSESKSTFFKRLYTDSGVVRINVEFENGSSYITATTGAASYPEDASNFDKIFELIDKMLYLGKRKGRNCYSIYNHKEHKDIEITKLANHGMFTTMKRLREEIEGKDSIEEKIKAVNPILLEILQISALYYIWKDGKIRCAGDDSFEAPADDIGNLMIDDMFTDRSPEKVKKESPIFYSSLQDKGFESGMISKIRSNDCVLGYLICVVTRSQRIWQENECAVMYYLAQLLADTK